MAELIPSCIAYLLLPSNVECSVVATAVKITVNAICSPQTKLNWADCLLSACSRLKCWRSVWNGGVTLTEDVQYDIPETPPLYSRMVSGGTCVIRCVTCLCHVCPAVLCLGQARPPQSTTTSRRSKTCARVLSMSFRYTAVGGLSVPPESHVEAVCYILCSSSLSVMKSVPLLSRFDPNTRSNITPRFPCVGRIRSSTVVQFSSHSHGSPRLSRA